MADKTIQLSVKVSAETGQLEVVGAKFKEVGDKAKGAQTEFNKLGGEAKDLLKSFLPFATAGGIIAFFTNAVKAAEDHSESMRRLRGNLEAAGISFERNSKQINDWSEAIQAATRFDNDVAIASLEKFVRATGSLANAQRATKLAMDLSVQSGKSLQETESLLINLLSNNERSLKEVNREFGAFTGNARSAQQAIDNLQTSVGGAAEREVSLTKTVEQTKAAFGDFSKQIGEAFSPAIAFILEGSTNVIRAFQTLGTAIAGNAVVILNAFQGIGNVFSAVISGQFKQLPNIVRESLTQVKETLSSTADEIGGIWEKQSQKQIDEAIRGNQGRLTVTVQMTEEMKSKVEQIEQELNQKLAAIGEDTFAKKKAMLDAEYNAEKAKINREILDKEAQKKLLDKLDVVYHKRGQELARLDAKEKMAISMQVAENALEALAIINNMEEGHSKEQARRAKLILALEKAIAIAKIWSATGTGNVVSDIALKTSSTALVVAQFAQQSQAIDQARSAAEAGRQELKLSTDLPGGSTLQQTFSTGSSASGGFSGGGSVSTAPSSGGGGSGTTMINVGGVTVHFQADHVDLSEVEVIARRLGEEVSRGTVEGVQLAVKILNAGQRNASLAV